MADVLARYEPLVDDHEAFRDACERPLPGTVRVNGIKATRAGDDGGADGHDDGDADGHDDGDADGYGDGDPRGRATPVAAAVQRVREAFAAEGVRATPVGWNPRVLRVDTDEPGNTWPSVHGWVHGQEEVSALPPLVVDPKPGERVWDACAAPGSKATQLADLMDDRGTLVANDGNLGRLSALRSNAERLGVTNVAVTNQDARSFSLEPFGFDAFDRALVDAPCSCEGTVRKNPDAVEDWSLDHVAAISGVQKGILRRAVQATRPGGTVVYATCTFAPEENEAVVHHVLSREDCRVVDYDVDLEASPGVTEWEGEQYDEGVRGTKRIYPHQNDTGGFFCAKLEVGG